MMIRKSGKVQKLSVHSRTKRTMQDGYLLPLTFILFLALLTSALSIMSVIAAKYAKTGRDTYVANAIYVAEAGVNDTISQFGANPSFAGFTTKKQFYSNGDRGRAEYTTAVTGSVATTLNIDATGYMYRTASDTVPYLTKRLKVQVKKNKVPVRENLIAGSGGLEVGSTATVTGDAIYNKGKLVMGSNATLGAATQNSNIYIANVACGDGITWPQPCGAASPPISSSGGPSWSIYGTICATDQTDPTGIYPGNGGTGLKPGCVVPSISQASFDKQSVIAGMDAANKKAASIYACPGAGTTVTIPANTWVVGDVKITPGTGTGECILEIGGNVYIEGKLTIGNYGRLKIADSVTSMPKIILSGQYFIANAFPGSTPVFQANSAGISGMLVSFYSTNIACSKSIDFPSSTVSGCLTTSEAKASATLPVSGDPTNGAMVCSGSNTEQDVSGAILYAYYGTVNCATGILKVTALAAQGISAGPGSKIMVQNATDKPFGELFSVSTYVISDYQQIY